MSGFAAEWLALREPADRAARDMGLARRLAHHLSGRDRPFILDLGCGTGSTLRSLAPLLPPTTAWELADHDPSLLEEAKRLAPVRANISFSLTNINEINKINIFPGCVASASALFDLCSAEFCQALFARLAEGGCGLYAALNYDGAMAWSRPHPLDGQAVAGFNRHQRGDKGFGPALGPEAADRLAQVAEGFGYAVHVADSPWRLGADDEALQVALLEGFRQPLTETGGLSEAQREDWLSFRLAHAGESLCRVGHRDLLALPR